MERKIAIALDLGGTQIKLGLIRGSEVVCSREISAGSVDGLEGRLPEIASLISEMLDMEAIQKSEIAGMGIAIPGIVDPLNKKVISINAKFSDVTRLDLEAWAKANLGVLIVMENDTRAALIGEWKFGSGQGFDNVVLMTLGTGVGTSAVIEGKLLRGKHFQAGILGGHFILNTQGKLCNCGTRGCVEAEASTWNLPEICRALSNGKGECSDFPDFKLVFEKAECGDSLAILIRDACIQNWAACAFNLVQAYDPEVVIVGGGIMGSSEFILPHIRKKLKENSWTTWGEVIVKESSLKNSAALLGVSSLIHNI